jgi:hypothetical protein
VQRDHGQKQPNRANPRIQPTLPILIGQFTRSKKKAFERPENLAVQMNDFVKQVVQKMAERRMSARMSVLPAMTTKLPSKGVLAVKTN